MARPPPSGIVAESDNIRNLVLMLKAIHFTPRCWLTFNSAGLRVSAESGRSVQAVAYLPASLFSTYTYSKPASLPSNDAPTGDDEGFSIDLRLDTLIQCLEIFGGIATGSEHKRSFRPDGDSDAEDSRAPMRENRKPVSLKMTFVELGGPLTIILEESGVLTRCELLTYEPADFMDIAFEDEGRLQKLIMKSGWLHDAMSELDKSCTKVLFKFQPAGTKSARFILETHSAAGVAEMEFPFEREHVELFECTKAISHCYSYGHLKHCIKALSGSTKTSIRTDANGLLSMQFMMPMIDQRHRGGQESGFVEFLLLPKDNDYA